MGVFNFLIEHSVIFWIIISLIAIRILFKFFKKSFMIIIAICFLMFIGITPMDVVNDIKSNIISEEKEDVKIDKSAILWHIELDENGRPILYLFDKIPIQLIKK